MDISALHPGQAISSVVNANDVHDKPIAFSIADGRIAGRGLKPAAENGAEDDAKDGAVDATGWLALPPMADVHAHIDKAFTWNAAGRPQGTLMDAIHAWFSYSPTIKDEEIKPRAERSLRRYIAAGVTALRSHADFACGGDPLAGIRALVELKHEYRGMIDLQVVPLVKEGMPDEWVYAAAKLDIDFLGAAPHDTHHPKEELDRILDIAEDTGRGTDLHTDETLDPHMLTILDYARRVKHWEPGRMRSAGHCVSLSVQQPDELDRILDVVREAGISIITNPQTNLYLQGWDQPVATPRGLAPLKAIREHGIPLGAGGDNMQDPFNPLGRGDMMEMTELMIEVAHDDPATAYLTASVEGRRIMGLKPADLTVGQPADFVLVKGNYLSEAIAFGAPDRIVVRGGKVIAVNRMNTELAACD